MAFSGDSAAHVGDAKVGAFAGAIGNDAATNTGENAAEIIIVIARHHHAVKGNVVEEVDEGVLDVGHVAIAVHVLAVDVGDDCEDRPEFQEGAVALVGLGHEVLGLAQAGIGTHGIDAAANDDRGIEAPGGQDKRHHRGGRGLAMHAGDGDSVFEAHQLGQHFGAGNHGDVEGLGRNNFRVVAGHGRTGDDDFGA